MFKKKPTLFRTAIAFSFFFLGRSRRVDSKLTNLLEIKQSRTSAGLSKINAIFIDMTHSLRSGNEGGRSDLTVFRYLIFSIILALKKWWEAINQLGL